MAHFGLETPPTGWAVVPVPLHPRRERVRGYNQSRLLAKGWCSILDMPLLDLLVRTRSGTTLTKFSRHQRLSQTRGLYAPKPGISTDDLQPLKGVLLMDDVITTGATLEAAHQAVRQVWDGPVGFITLLDAAR